MASCGYDRYGPCRYNLAISTYKYSNSSYIFRSPAWSTWIITHKDTNKPIGTPIRYGENVEIKLTDFGTSRIT